MDLAVCCKSHRKGILNHLFVQYRKGTRHTGADRAGMGIWCSSESSGAGTEYFCFGRKLYMDFQTDHGFILFSHLILPPLLLFLQALVLRISSSVHKHTPPG